MLKINNLTITTDTGRILAEDFSFVVNEGDKVALIGEEGNGKSTLLKIFAGYDLSYITYTGNIYRDGNCAYLPQTISEEDLEKTVTDYIDPQLDYNFLYTQLRRISIDPELIGERKMKSLSGGEKVKISLLKLLYEQADILLLDEPSNDLDLKTLIWLEEFIKNCDTGMIFVSHDETLLENCADSLLHLEQLKRKSESHITYSGLSYADYLQERKLFIDRNNQIAAKEKAEFNKQLERWRQIYQKVEYRQNTISRGDPHGGQLLKKKMKSVKAQGRRLEEERKDLRARYEPEEAIDIFFEDVKMNPDKVILDFNLKELKNEDKVLAEDVHLHVRGKDRICIIGDNGTGKSTLIRLIAKELLTREDIRCGYMPQNYAEVMDYDQTPVEFLWDGKTMEGKAKVGQYLGALRFTSEEMEHKISALSEGQKCKILLLKMILEENDVLILDEPSRNLSPLSNPILRKILRDFKGCIIAVSHDRKFIDEVADTVYELSSEGLTPIE